MLSLLGEFFIKKEKKEERWDVENLNKERTVNIHSDISKGNDFEQQGHLSSVPVIKFYLCNLL